MGDTFWTLFFLVDLGLVLYFVFKD